MELKAVPPFLSRTSDGPPASLTVEPGQNGGEPYVCVYWGGGFGHWGLKIGSPSFRAPDDGDYQLEWEPGVYVWHDIQ